MLAPEASFVIRTLRVTTPARFGMLVGAVLAAVLAVTSFGSARAEDAGEGEARRSARVFGQALTSGQASLLRAILPTGGKVHVAVPKIVPEEGWFTGSQVEALLADFLSQGSVRSFEVLRLESDGKTNALARGRAVLTDRQGRPQRLGIHLAFQPEDERWVLREIKETLE
jgi:hypothetical protein